MESPRLDDDVILRMGAGDPGAFKELYIATSDAVFGYALSIVKNVEDAEDVMHDAFIKAYQSAASYQPLGKPLAWMLTIVRNLSYSKIRLRKPVTDLRGIETIAAPELSNPIDRMVLDAALGILDPDEREIVILHALTGMKHREISQFLRLPLGTVLSKYHRALGKLRSEIEGRG